MLVYPTEPLDTPEKQHAWVKAYFDPEGTHPLPRRPPIYKGRLSLECIATYDIFVTNGSPLYNIVQPGWNPTDYVVHAFIESMTRYSYTERALLIRTAWDAHYAWFEDFIQRRRPLCDVQFWFIMHHLPKTSFMHICAVSVSGLGVDFSKTRDKILSHYYARAYFAVSGVESLIHTKVKEPGIVRLIGSFLTDDITPKTKLFVRKKGKKRSAAAEHSEKAKRVRVTTHPDNKDGF